MSSAPAARRTGHELRAAVSRILAIADAPDDDDDARLRKRVGIVAGLFTLVAPLGLIANVPSLAGWVAALGLSAYSLVNLLILARTRRFERYAIVMLASGPPFVLATIVMTGGVTGSSGGIVWAFLAPGYALLALGSRRATPWFLAFLVTLLVSVAIDPIVRTWVQPPPYVVQLIFHVQNVGVPLTVTFLLLRYVDLRRRAAEARSDELLTNAIPRSIAQRLRRGESKIAESYPETTVVFADVVGFTPWANRTEPGRVVTLLDDLFTRLDHAAAELGLEKIKTVGDSYMAAAGAPAARSDHAAAGVAFGRAILREVEGWRRANDIDLRVRVGMASGPVVGGVIGQHRILFDLWGGTVNTAARMESSGVPGRVQVASSTRDLVGDAEAFEERTVDVKGLGELTTYLLLPA